MNAQREKGTNQVFLMFPILLRSRLYHLILTNMQIVSNILKCNSDSHI